MIASVAKQIKKIYMSSSWTPDERKSLKTTIEQAIALTQNELDRHCELVTYDSPFKKDCLIDIKYFEFLILVLDDCRSEFLETNRHEFERDFVFNDVNIVYDDADILNRLQAAENLCKIYFKIAADEIGEEKVRNIRDGILMALRFLPAPVINAISPRAVKN